MLHKPTDKQMAALSRLSSNNDFIEVMKWYESMLNKQDIQNRTARQETLFQGQGTSQTLAFIIEYSDKAKVLNKKIKALKAGQYSMGQT